MDKKTIIGVVLMSAIFIVYMVFTSRQQAEYQEYLKQVQAEAQLLQAEQTQTESSSSASFLLLLWESKNASPPVSTNEPSPM